MITRLNHVQITIPAGREADGKAFYCDVLGLREVDKPTSLAGRGGFWLELGDIQVHVGTENGFDRLTTKSHLAYEVDDIDAWRSQIVSNGLIVEECVAIPGFARFEFRDPFGNRIEIIQPVG